jgi:cyclophilin family peptidyl-prolyl cis-trans isomerase
MKRILQLSILITLFFGTLPVAAQIKKAVTKKTVSTVKRTTKKPLIKPKPVIVPIEIFTRVKISTVLGEIVVKLYNKTPLHRDNFIKLVTDHFYDSLLFHRVINGFMIQGGDPNSKNTVAGSMLGMGDVGYTIPAEFDTTLFHKRGALCAARTENPEKASSGCQFYIVDGRKISDGEDVAILSIGHIGNHVVEAKALLLEEELVPAHYDMRFVKPIDEAMLHEVFKKFKKI